MKKIILLCILLNVISCQPEPIFFELNVKVSPEGSGNVNPLSGTFEEGSSVTIKVSPNNNFTFDSWSGQWSGSENPLTLVMDANKTLIANFSQKDDDGDGVINSIDICPNTPQGEEVDSNGCILSKIYFESWACKCPNAEIGDSEELNGITYTVVDNTTIKEEVAKENYFLCTTLVTNMYGLFRDNTSFNEDISFWDTSNVTNMSTMFYGAQNFNTNIRNWDTKNVTEMRNMFAFATSFNTPLTGWDTSKVTDMFAMFRSAISFNQPLSHFDTSNVTRMNSMFTNTSFNQDIGNWDVSNVTNMNGMFWESSFNQDIGNWDVSNVTDMSFMFNLALSFNKDIGNWNVSKVTDMEGMFLGAENFNQDISRWDTSNVTNMYGMFYNTSFNQDIGNWDVSNVTDMSYMFQGSDFNQDISGWCVSKISNEPDYFSQSLTQDSFKPIWGRPCSPFHTYVPDDNFEQLLIDLGLDDVMDDLVLTSKISGYSGTLQCYRCGISDLTGIEDFVSLTELRLWKNSISSLNLSNNHKLIELTVGANLLTELDLTNNPDLRRLNIGGDMANGGNNDSNKNLIKNLDLTKNSELVYINVNLVGLESIDVSNQVNLVGLSISGNPEITSIDLSNNTNLRWFSNSKGRLTELDLSNQSNLGYLSLRASRSLKSIDISNNNYLLDFDAEFSSIECIQVSQFQLDNQILNVPFDELSVNFPFEIPPFGGFIVKFSDEAGQVFSSFNWNLPLTAVYSLECN